MGLSIPNTNDFSPIWQDVEGVDLEMLAPYISMDDDFQLNFLSLPEDVEAGPSSSPDPPQVTPEVPGNRKRYLTTSAPHSPRKLLLILMQLLCGCPVI